MPTGSGKAGPGGARGDLPGGRGAGAGPLGGAAGGQRPSRPRSQMTSRWRASWASWKRTSEGNGPQSRCRDCSGGGHSCLLRDTVISGSVLVIQQNSGIQSPVSRAKTSINTNKQTNKRKNQRKACLWPPRRGGRPSPRLALSSSSGPLLCPTLELRPRL